MTVLKEYRKDKKLTQKELASLIGVEELTILRYEQGKRMPSIVRLNKISKALNLTQKQRLKLLDSFDEDNEN